MALFCCPVSAQETCELPAYSHNDYENRRPLLDALAAGYSGVEADYYLTRGQLLVGHDASSLESGRTLSRLYLDPMRKAVLDRGWICRDKPFLFTIEAKQEGYASFVALWNLLNRYPDLFSHSDSTRHPLVRAVLVGWEPHRDSIQARRVIAGVQNRVRSPGAIDSIAADSLVYLVSVRYRDLFHWNGTGEPDVQFAARLRGIVTRAHHVVKRRVRVYDVPSSEAVYRALLNGGVDLIGIEDLWKGREILLRIGDKK